MHFYATEQDVIDHVNLRYIGVSTRDDTLAVVITSISQKVSIGDAYQMQLTKESSLNEGKNTSHIVSYLQDFRKVCS
jgi:hypothetical protein